jgi:hypothetical protein
MQSIIAYGAPELTHETTVYDAQTIIHIVLTTLYTTGIPLCPDEEPGPQMKAFPDLPNPGLPIIHGLSLPCR